MRPDLSKIQKVLFDVDYYDKHSAPTLQNRIISEFNTRIHRILDKRLNKFSQSDFIKIKHFELDLGNLSRDDVENNLPRLIEEELVVQLEKLRNRIENGLIPEGVELITYDNLVYEYLYHFFTSGIIPWNLQEFGQAHSIIYWLDYLEANNQRLLNKVSLLFSSESARKRILAAISYSERRELYKKVFSSKINVVIKRTDYLLANLFRIIDAPESAIFNAYLEHFLLNMGAEMVHLGKSDLTSREIATLFFEFIGKNIGEEDYHVFSPLLHLVNQKRNLSKEAIEIVDVISRLYINKLNQLHHYSFEIGDENRYILLSKQAFENYLKVNFAPYSELLKVLNFDLTQIIAESLPQEENLEIGNIVRSVFINSLKPFLSQYDFTLWQNSILNEVTYSFGTQSHSKVVSYFTSDSNIFEDIKKVEKEEQSFGREVKREMKDYPGVQEFILVEKGNNYKVNVQDAVKYITILSDFGLGLFGNIFAEPYKSLEKIILWLSKAHTSYFNKVSKYYLVTASELTKWQVAEFISAEASSVLNKEEVKHYSLGYVLWAEIRKNGAVPTYELNRLGRGRLENALTDYFQKPEPAPEFLKTLMPQVSYEYLEDILPLNTIEQIQYLWLLEEPEIEKVFKIKEPKPVPDITLETKVKRRISGLKTEFIKEIDNELERLTFTSEEREKTERSIREKLEDKFEARTEQLLQEFTKEEQHEEVVRSEIRAELNIEKLIKDAVDKRIEGEIEKDRQKPIRDIATTEELTSEFESKESKKAETVQEKHRREQQVFSFQLLVHSFLEGDISENELKQLVSEIEQKIDSRNQDFAVFLLSLTKEKLEAVKRIMATQYKTKIEQLIKSFEYKYKPHSEDELAKKQERESSEKLKKRISAGDVFYVNNAGVVIVYPYILPLFSRLNLVKGKDFINDESRVKGALAIQYLVTGTDQAEEPELLLNKLLVGMELHEPFVNIPPLAEEEKEICDSLLDAIIGHWTALKNSSRENIRASFFIRSGKLVFDQAAWRLTVENKTYDILVDRLPWTFSMIKLPWMEHSVIVEWR